MLQSEREEESCLSLGKQEAIACRVHYIPTNMSKEKILIDETEMQMWIVECSEN